MLWRVRTSLTDRPGSLARLTAICGENGLNILALQIFPEIGSVVDELVLEAVDAWTAQDIAGLVASAGGDTVRVSPCGSQDLVDEPVRWLRAAEAIIARPSDRGRVVDRLTGASQSAWSFAENARVSALLDVIGAADALEASTDAAATAVVYEVLPDAVIAKVGDSVVATGSLDAGGTATVVVSPTWRRRGIGRAVFVMLAGVARHAGHTDLLLVAPGAELGSSISEGGATLAMLDRLGLRGLIKLKHGLLQIRISLADIRPLAPRSIAPDDDPVPA